MKEYDIEVKFIDGTKVIVEIEADSEEEALNNAMPVSFTIRN
jgi:hypothetical protein